MLCTTAESRPYRCIRPIGQVRPRKGKLQVLGLVYWSWRSCRYRGTTAIEAYMRGSDVPDLGFVLQMVGDGRESAPSALSSMC